MLEEEARVVSVSGGQAVVAMTRSEACAGCSARGACGPGSGREREIPVANPVGAGPGDRVIVTITSAALFKAGVVAYFVPAGLLVAGAALGWSRTGTDLGALAGGILGLVLGGVLLAFSGRDKGQGPRITKVIG